MAWPRSETASRVKVESSQTAAPGPFGIADATARALVNGIARDPRLSSTHPFVAGMRHGYERLPPAARGAAVADAFAWIKSYVDSSAFSTAYLAARQRAKPAGLPSEQPTVDAELKNKIEAERAKIEQARGGVALLPAEDRPKQLAFLKEQEDRLSDPATVKAMRDEIEAGRADLVGPGSAFTQWTDRYPPTARDLVKQGLARFLEVAARVDLAVPVTPIKSPGGAIEGFVAPIDHVLEWLDVECLLAGRDMVLAARTAAQTWLKELST